MTDEASVEDVSSSSSCCFSSSSFFASLKRRWSDPLVDELELELELELDGSSSFFSSSLDPVSVTVENA